MLGVEQVFQDDADESTIARHHFPAPRQRGLFINRRLQQSSLGELHRRGGLNVDDSRLDLGLCYLHRFTQLFGSLTKLMLRLSEPGFCRTTTIGHFVLQRSGDSRTTGCELVDE